MAQIVGAVDITATGAISEEVEATRYFYIESPRLKTTPCTCVWLVIRNGLDVNTDVTAVVEMP